MVDIINMRYVYMIKINLSRLLGERKMTQAELARRTGIGTNTVNAYYHEYAKYLRKEDIDKICEVLCCDLAELLKYVPNKQKITL